MPNLHILNGRIITLKPRISYRLNPQTVNNHSSLTTAKAWPISEQFIHSRSTSTSPGARKKAELPKGSELTAAAMVATPNREARHRRSTTTTIRRDRRGVPVVRTPSRRRDETERLLPATNSRKWKRYFRRLIIQMCIAGSSSP